MTDTQDLIVRLREGLNGWLKSPMLTKAADALEAAQAEIERLEKLSVTNIMLAVVPGDGSGLEVYAQSVADVEQKLGDIGSELEDWQLGIKRYPAFQEIVDQRAAALARLAEIEATHTDEVINGLMLEKSLANLQTQEPVGTVDRTAPGFIAWAGIPKLKDGAKLYAAAGASNVQPSQAGEPVVYQSRMRPLWGRSLWNEWSNCTKGVHDDYKKTPILNDWEFEARALSVTQQDAQQPSQEADYQAFIDALTDPEDKMFEQIDLWTRQSYARHKSSVRGQQITAADSMDSHRVWAALRWVKENAQPSQALELSDKNEPAFAWWCESSDCITRSSHVLNNWITKGIKAIPLYK